MRDLKFLKVLLKEGSTSRGKKIKISWGGEHLKYNLNNHKANARSRVLPVRKVLKEIRRRTRKLKIDSMTHPVKPIRQTVELGITRGANRRCERPIYFRDRPARCGLHNRRRLHPTVQS